MHLVGGTMRLGIATGLVLLAAGNWVEIGPGDVAAFSEPYGLVMLEGESCLRWQATHLRLPSSEVQSGSWRAGAVPSALPCFSTLY